MKIRIQVENMRQAEKLSAICNNFPYEISLHAKQFSADPKSVLGVLAMMYSDRSDLLLDTGDMPDGEIDKLSRELTEFVKPENAEAAE